MSLSFPGFAANNSEKKAAAPSNQTVNQTQSNNSPAKQPTISWPIDLQLLSGNNSADEMIWLDIEEDKLLVLKYWAKGSKKRGNIILLPAEGENADHPRLIKPLTLQLSQLGWQVFIATLPVEDYPIETPTASKNQPLNEENKTPSQQDTANQQKETTNDSLTQAKTFFPSKDDYQKLINLVIQKLVSQIQPQADPLMIIGNQNTAFWMLQETKQNSRISQVVLLEPLVPKMSETDIKTSFNGQTLPVYTFIKNAQQSKSFIRAFENNLWTSIYYRIDTAVINNSNLNIEDIRLAKKITGWSDSINRSSF